MRCGDCLGILRQQQRDVAADLRTIVAGGPGDQDLRFGEQQRAEAVGLDSAGRWISERSRASFLAARTRVRISRIAATTEKPSKRQRRGQHRDFLVVEVEQAGSIACSRGRSPACAGWASAVRAAPTSDAKR